jgi:hypothetical protein
MNRPILILLVAACVAPLTVLAQTTEPTPPAVTASEPDAAQPSQPAADEGQAKAKAPRAQPYCLHETGSRIRQTRERCAAIGDAYDRGDLQRTGAIDVGDALRRLDTSIH